MNEKKHQVSKLVIEYLRVKRNLKIWYNSKKPIKYRGIPSLEEKYDYKQGMVSHKNQLPALLKAKKELNRKITDLLDAEPAYVTISGVPYIVYNSYFYGLGVVGPDGYTKKWASLKIKKLRTYRFLKFLKWLMIILLLLATIALAYYAFQTIDTSKLLPL